MQKTTAFINLFLYLSTLKLEDFDVDNDSRKKLSFYNKLKFSNPYIFAA